jgi:hypothetical protein
LVGNVPLAENPFASSAEPYALPSAARTQSALRKQRALAFIAPKKFQIQQGDHFGSHIFESLFANGPLNPQTSALAKR